MDRPAPLRRKCASRHQTSPAVEKAYLSTLLLPSVVVSRGARNVNSVLDYEMQMKAGKKAILHNEGDLPCEVEGVATQWR